MITGNGDRGKSGGGAAVCPVPPVDSSVLESELSSAERLEDALRRARRLGILTKKSTTSEELDGRTASQRDDWREEQYELLETAASLLPHERVAACLQYVVPGEAAEVRYCAECGSASIHNVAVCGSVWTCPVCSARINAERGAELARAVSNAQVLGYGVVLVTLTLQHKLGDALGGLIDDLKTAWSDTKSGGSWSRYCERNGLIAHVTALEVLHGDNGWHPHLHVLLFFNRPMRAAARGELECWLSDRYRDMLYKRGVYASERYGVVVSDGKSAAQYLTKWTQSKSWDISRELTSRRGKTVKSGRSAFQLLADFRGGDVQAGLLFREYAEATKGVQQLRRSNGFNQVLCVSVELGGEEEPTAEELLLDALERERAASELVLELSQVQYSWLVEHNGRAALLRAVEVTRGDALVVWTWLIQQGMPIETEHVDQQRAAAFSRQREVRRERERRRQEWEARRGDLAAR